jgi:hypothetical protein
MRDYKMSKLFFDLQDPATAAEFRRDKEPFLSRYKLDDTVKAAIRSDDAPFLAARTNAYLLRYYFFAIGIKDDEFVRRLNDG